MAYPPEAYAPQRPAALTAMVVCLVIIGLLQVFVGVVLYALAFPFVVCDGFYLVLAVLAFVVSAGLWQMAESVNTAMERTPGVASISNSWRFPSSSGERMLMPVVLPPGRASEATNPSPEMWGYAPPYGPGQGAYPLPYPPAYPPAYPPPIAPPAVPETAPVAPRSKFCRNCGSPLDANAVSCPSCGKQVS